MKAKKLSVKDMAILAVAAGFAWTKLGLGVAVKEVAPAAVANATGDFPDCGPGERLHWDGKKYVCVIRL